MYPYLRVGPFLLQLPGLVLLIGVWVGLSLAEKEAKKLKINVAVVYNMVLYGLVAGLIGARLVYAARYARVYLDNPLSLIALNPNTISPYEGLAVGVIVAVFYGWRKQLPLQQTLDALAPGLALFMVFFAVGHFLSGNAFGSPTDLPWAIYLWDEYRHPSQVYEFLAASGIFLIAWKRPQGNLGSGINFLVVASLSAFSRLFLEAFRGDSLLVFNGLRAAQLASLALVLGCMWLMRIWTLDKGKTGKKK